MAGKFYTVKKWVKQIYLTAPGDNVPVPWYEYYRGYMQYPGGGEGGGVLDIMHGRSRMAIDRPLYLYHTETEHVGFLPTRQTMRAPSAKRGEVFGESNEATSYY